ncbi:437_t:CDS:2 [Diversispora eburnea]|uniref:437_t:CDS:1 n=1 Tax=Diversispora eburnea TaxID=1213867 RepID=A0A9N9FAE6_9GLOM|nr:437_t:CDS:2 [Diversispora eburnea]
MATYHSKTYSDGSDKRSSFEPLQRTRSVVGPRPLPSKSSSDRLSTDSYSYQQRQSSDNNNNGDNENNENKISEYIPEQQHKFVIPEQTFPPLVSPIPQKYMPTATKDITNALEKQYQDTNEQEIYSSQTSGKISDNVSLNQIPGTTSQGQPPPSPKSPIQQPVQSNDSPEIQKNISIENGSAEINSIPKNNYIITNNDNASSSSIHVQNEAITLQQTLYSQSESFQSSTQQQNQLQSPLIQQQSPLNQQESPLNQQQSPLNQQQSPLNQQQSPLNQQQSSLNQQQSYPNQPQNIQPPSNQQPIYYQQQQPNQQFYQQQPNQQFYQQQPNQEFYQQQNYINQQHQQQQYQNNQQQYIQNNQPQNNQQQQIQNNHQSYIQYPQPPPIQFQPVNTVQSQSQTRNSYNQNISQGQYNGISITETQYVEGSEYSNRRKSGSSDMYQRGSSPSGINIINIGPDGEPIPSSLSNGRGSWYGGSRSTTPDRTSRISTNPTLKLLIDEKNARRKTATSKTLALDENAALQKYREAAKKTNDPTIQIDYAKFLMHMAELNLEAIYWINQLAKNNHPEALYIKGSWYENGKFGREKNEEKAYKLYVSSSKQEFAKAQCKVAEYHEKKNKDYKRALQFYKKAASNGCNVATYRLASIYLHGELKQDVDYKQALIFLKQSASKADEECPDGAYVYGMILAREYDKARIPDDLAIPYDYEAKELILKAANLGHAPALYKMGYFYEYALLKCPFDPELSLQYYKRASEKGYIEADMAISKWYLCGTEGYFDRNESLAFEYAEIAALKGLPAAEFAMGYFHEVGIHVPVNETIANEWYQKAAAHGNKDAIERLSKGGKISRQDYEKDKLGKSIGKIKDKDY